MKIWDEKSRELKEQITKVNEKRQVKYAQSKQGLFYGEAKRPIKIIIINCQTLLLFNDRLR